MANEPDKNAESILALKNANKHLEALFSNLQKKDLVLKNTADDLDMISKQCGDLKVEAWVGNSRQTVSLKTFLAACANTLNGAR